MDVRKVSFFSEGSRIDAEYFVPDPGGTPSPGIVLCHGYSALKSFVLPDYAKMFAEAGYPTLIFDYRGFGASEGPKWRIMPAEQIQDIQNAMTWLEAQPEVIEGQLGLWGTSYGGSHVISVAAIDERARCVVAQTGFADGEELATSRYTPDEREAFLQRLQADRRQRVLTGKGDVAPPHELLNSPESEACMLETIKYMPEVYTEIGWDSVEAMLHYRPIDQIAKIAPRAVMLIAAEFDSLSPVESYRRLYDTAGEPKAWADYPVRHYDIYQPEWIQRSGEAARKWFDQHL